MKVEQVRPQQKSERKLSLKRKKTKLKTLTTDEQMQLDVVPGNMGNKGKWIYNTFDNKMNLYSLFQAYIMYMADTCLKIQITNFLRLWGREELDPNIPNELWISGWFSLPDFWTLPPPIHPRVNHIIKSSHRVALPLPPLPLPLLQLLLPQLLTLPDHQVKPQARVGICQPGALSYIDARCKGEFLVVK